MKINYYILLLSVLLMASCSKELMVDEAPDLEITTESTTYKAGDPVIFKFNGNADIISFYSGQESNDYAFKDGKVIDVAGAGVEMSFTTAVSVANANLQNNQLKVLASNNFNGDYSSLAKVKESKWTDITNLFVINGTTVAFVSSGVKDISELITDPSKPIYIAFQYTTKPQGTNGLARIHYIQSFLMKSKATPPAGITKSLTLADQLTAGFTIVDENPVNAPARASTTTTRVTLYGNIYKDLTRKDPASPIWDPNDPIFDPENPIYVYGSPTFDQFAVRPTYVPFDPTSPYNDPTSEHWAISGAIYTNKVDLGPDRAIAVKGMTNGKLDEYRFIYTQPGNYKAVFDISNNTVDETKQIIKEVNLTITP